MTQKAPSQSNEKKEKKGDVCICMYMYVYMCIYTGVTRTSGLKGWLDTTRMGTPTPLVPGSDLPYAT